MSISRWSGRVAVVTGASAGIGEATCIEFCKHGLITIGLARRVEKMEEIRKSLSPEQSKLFHAMKCDVSNEAEIVQVFAEIEKKFGGVDVLVNNAGVIAKYNMIDENSASDMKRVIDTNVFGVINCTREAVKTMRKKNEAHVIHINSVAGHSMPFIAEFPAFGIYTASKYAVTAIAEQHRQEFIKEKLNIKVTSLSPGAVATEIFDTMNTEKTDPEKIKEFMAKIPFLASKDIADSIVFLLSTPPNVLITELTIRPMNEAF
ncbi:hypothetical protein PVAND_000516 [Polypedilum vanderplanki]|uniref:Dehydrogenase n=1 Tax=Polypedilum vanderplanki TaxID=319348 RepID=A0A9J6BKU3_POLVA|nr:hypothetical protein PVAND_000516 [Polypedilum vanderplanki]